MPETKEAVLLELRLRYNAVYTAHLSCVRAITECRMSGEVPSVALLENEAAAQYELMEAGRNLMAGMHVSATHF